MERQEVVRRLRGELGNIISEMEGIHSSVALPQGVGNCTVISKLRIVPLPALPRPT
jgi:hypothetical protein